MVASVPYALVARKDFPASTLKELIDYAKANPGKITYASSSVGSTAQLAALQLQMMTGTQMLHVPYRGAAPALNDVMAGHVDLVFDIVSTTRPMWESKLVKVLGTGDTTRSRIMPTIPTIAEAGLPGYEALTWFAMVGPPDLPNGIVDKISHDTLEALKVPTVAQRIRELGMDVVGLSPADSAKFFAQEAEHWGKIVKAAGISASTECTVELSPMQDAAVLTNNGSMRERVEMYNANALKIGLFGANCSSARTATLVPERWLATWPDCLKLARIADEARHRFPAADRTLEGLWRRQRLPRHHARDRHLGLRSARRDAADHGVRHRSCPAVPSADRRQGDGHRRPHRQRPLRAQPRGRLERRRVRRCSACAARARRALRVCAGMDRRDQARLVRRRSSISTAAISSSPACGRSPARSAARVRSS